MSRTAQSWARQALAEPRAQTGPSNAQAAIVAAAAFEPDVDDVAVDAAEHAELALELVEHVEHLVFADEVVRCTGRCCRWRAGVVEEDRLDARHADGQVEVGRRSAAELGEHVGDVELVGVPRRAWCRTSRK